MCLLPFAKGTLQKVLNYQCCMRFGVCTYKINIHFDCHFLPIAHTSLYSYIIFDIFCLMQWHRIHPTDSSGIKFAQNKVHVWHKHSVFVNIYYFKINQNCLPWHFLFYVHYLLLFLELWIHSWFVWFHWVGITLNISKSPISFGDIWE
jgi:hypothetical protein